MKHKRRARLFWFAWAFLLAGLPTNGHAQLLSPIEEARIIAGTHLLLKGQTDPFIKTIATNDPFNESYWKNVFAVANKPDLYSAIEANLKAAFNEAANEIGPLQPKSHFALVMFGALGPYPYNPITKESISTANNLKNFADKSVCPLFIKIKKGEKNSDPLSLNFSNTPFASSGYVTKTFNQFIDTCRGFSDANDKMLLLDIKDRLEGMIRIFGLHVSVDQGQMADRRCDAGLYLVSGRNVVDYKNENLALNQISPLCPTGREDYLGSAESEERNLFLYQPLIDAAVKDRMAFLTNTDEFGPDRKSQLTLLLETYHLKETDIVDVETRLRKTIIADSPQLLNPVFFRYDFIESIGHHEIYHRVSRKKFEAGTATKDLSPEEKAALDEEGAYLFQVKTAKPAFRRMDLLTLVETAYAFEPSPNKTGAFQALKRLNVAWKGLDFFDNRDYPTPAGLIRLFEASPEKAKDASTQALWDFEMSL